MAAWWGRTLSSSGIRGTRAGLGRAEPPNIARVSLAGNRGRELEGLEVRQRTDVSSSVFLRVRLE